jgi:two-component system sensor histidine kinase RpfC
VILAPFYSRFCSILSSQTQRWLSRDRLKAVIAAAPQPELGQAVLRVTLFGIILAYLFWYVLRDGVIESAEYEFLAVTSGFLAFSVLLTLFILAAPHVSVPRRLLGMVVDNALATYGLIQMGEGGAVILFVYFFITFGNGFRYGRFYLHASQLMGIAGFSLVFVVSPFWSQHFSIWLGDLIALIMVPFYVGILAERINAARVRAEEALRECIERERRGP